MRYSEKQMQVLKGWNTLNVLMISRASNREYLES